MNVSETVETPHDFSEVWDLISELRAVRDAPVDLWGCDKVVDPSAPKDVLEFQTLVAAMLSSQTKDKMVKEGMDNLIKADLSVGGILALTEAEIDDKIRMVGFHNTKARNIRLVAKIIQTEYDGRVPNKFDELVKLPGVGPKMANLVMACAFNESSGICVDTHVHRISTLLGWGCKSCKPACKQPEHTRAILEAWVPKKMWRDFTYMLVGLGQQSQGSRQLLVKRCISSSNPVASLKFLKRIKMNLNGFDLRAMALEAGVTDPSILEKL